jgi:hypothetical protein
MARKRTDVPDQVATETLPPNPGTTAPSEAAPQNGSEPNSKKKPCYKVGPIATGKGESVSGCVWENEHVMPDGRVFKVHSIQLELSYFHEGDRQWKPSKSIRPSQISAVEYVLRQCGDFCFRARDPQNDIDF